MKKMITSAIVLMISLASYIPHAKGATIFKHYTFGMSKQTILHDIKGTYDCTKYIGTSAVCLDNQTFAGVPVELIFGFYNNKLVSVTLMTDYTQARYLKLFSAISTEFYPLMIQCNNKKMDIIKEFRRDPKTASIKIKEFESSCLSSGNVVYVFLDKKHINKNFTDQTNLYQLLESLPDNTREVDFRIMKNSILVSFIVPKKAAELLRKSLNQVHVGSF